MVDTIVLTDSDEDSVQPNACPSPQRHPTRPNPPPVASSSKPTSTPSRGGFGGALGNSNSQTSGRRQSAAGGGRGGVTGSSSQTGGGIGGRRASQPAGSPATSQTLSGSSRGKDKGKGKRESITITLSDDEDGNLPALGFASARSKGTSTLPKPSSLNPAFSSQPRASSQSRRREPSSSSDELSIPSQHGRRASLDAAHPSQHYPSSGHSSARPRHSLPSHPVGLQGRPALTRSTTTSAAASSGSKGSAPCPSGERRQSPPRTSSTSRARPPATLIFTSTNASSHLVQPSAALKTSSQPHHPAKPPAPPPPNAHKASKAPGPATSYSDSNIEFIKPAPSQVVQRASARAGPSAVKRVGTTTATTAESDSDSAIEIVSGSPEKPLRRVPDGVRCSAAGKEEREKPSKPGLAPPNEEKEVEEEIGSASSGPATLVATTNEEEAEETRPRSAPKASLDQAGGVNQPLERAGLEPEGEARGFAGSTSPTPSPNSPAEAGFTTATHSRSPSPPQSAPTSTPPQTSRLGKARKSTSGRGPAASVASPVPNSTAAPSASTAPRALSPSPPPAPSSLQPGPSNQLSSSTTNAPAAHLHARKTTRPKQNRALVDTGEPLPSAVPIPESPPRPASAARLETSKRTASSPPPAAEGSRPASLPPAKRPCREALQAAVEKMTKQAKKKDKGKGRAVEPDDETPFAVGTDPVVRDELDDPEEGKRLEKAYNDFLYDQVRKAPNERQVAGPTFNLYAEFTTDIQDHVNKEEQAWKEGKLVREPGRYCYASLFEQIIQDANSEFPPGTEVPQIRILPAIGCDATDWTSPPFELIYTNRVVYDQGIVPTQAPGCGCKGNCKENQSTCECLKRQIAVCQKKPTSHYRRSEIKGFAWNDEGCLDDSVFSHADLIIECNSQCGCGPECINRVAGQKKGISVDILWTGLKGWGVRLPPSWEREDGSKYTQRIVKKGQPLAIYAGELLRTPDSARRDEIVYSHTKRNYIYDLDSWQIGEELEANAPQAVRDKVGGGNHDGTAKSAAGAAAAHAAEDDEGFQSLYSVDAFCVGNWTRFANHVCDEFNAVPRAVYVDDADVSRPLWVYVAKRDILPGEEISISYYGSNDAKADYDEWVASKNVKRRADEWYAEWKANADELRTTSDKHHRCYCGKKYCRGVMFN
ncbi:hypothetical protein JCM11641_001383 [Rhodosporidiobolus odoratus]